MKNRGLGRGLSALLKEQVLPLSSIDEMIKMVEIDSIEAGTFQPRKLFESDKIQELANSITSNGLLQPLIVTHHPENIRRYKLVAGERRWRACKLANINEVPVIIKNYDDDEILRIALLENIQREELSIIEEAEGYLQLIKQFHYTQEDLSHKLGKSRSHIANLIRLTNLSQYIKDKLNEGLLTMGHARCLIGHEHAETIADYIIENDLSVRQAENIVKGWSEREFSINPDNSKVRKLHNKNNDQDNDLESLARMLSDKYNVKVSIEDFSPGGKIIFHYKDHEQLDAILSKLN
jgi:ParB family chromosome partitioning protein